MYQALYRKYRPKNFNEIVGQDIIKKTIINEINNNKISHAYLFCGPRGTGKTSIAKLIAKLINCTNQKDGMSCEQCTTCVNHKNNVDIIEIDAASNNGVDEIRELKSKVNLLPANSKYKIYIIDEVHMLSIGAFNALLKTLEEPPAHVIFILATTEINKIPITIVSRCQRFDFNKISSKKIYERLKYIAESEKINIEDEAILEISKLTDGGMRDAIGILDKLISYTTEKITASDVHEINYTVTNSDLNKIIKMLFQNDVKEYINFIDDLDNRGKDLIKLVDELMFAIRDILLGTSTEKIDINIPTNILLEYINSLNELSYKMKITNYPKILLETFIISLNGSKNINLNVEKEPIEEPKKEVVIEQEKVSETKEETIAVSASSVEEVKETLTESEEKVYDNSEGKIIKEIKTLEELKKIRVNNTLSICDKKLLNDLKDNWKQISEYSVNQIYGVQAGMLLDSELTVVSEKNILVVFPYQSMADRANDEIPRIEEILKNVFNQEYKFIALDNSEWNVVKREYIKNLKNNIKYKYVDENTNYDIIFNKKDDIIVDQAIEYFGASTLQVI